MSELGFELCAQAGTYFLTTDIAAVFDSAMAWSSVYPARTLRRRRDPDSVFYDDKESSRSLVRWAFCKRRDALEEALSRTRRRFDASGGLASSRDCGRISSTAPTSSIAITSADPRRGRASDGLDGSPASARGRSIFSARGSPISRSRPITSSRPSAMICGRYKTQRDAEEIAQQFGPLEEAMEAPWHEVFPMVR